MKKKLIILFLVIVMSTGGLLAQSKVTSSNQKDTIHPLYAASYDHMGIILWGKKTFENVLDTQLIRLAKYPEYAIGMDNEAYTYDFLADSAAELLSIVKSAIIKYNGRFGIAACTYGQPLSMFINEESNIRQLTYGLDAIEKHLGITNTVYIMSEHPFHAQLPQLLKGCGYKGAVLRTHFMMYGQNPEFNEPVGLWKGVDGSRIPALPTYKGQLSTSLSYFFITGYTSTLDNRILTDAISENISMTLTDFRKRFENSVQPVIATRADDPRTNANLISFHKNDKNVRWITAEDIFKILPEPKVDFITQPNDFKVRMPWGYCGNRIWNSSREAEIKVLTAERLDAIAFSLTKSSHEKELEAAWKNLLIAQHHDIQICGIEKDATHFLGESLNKSNGLIDLLMKIIAERIGYTENSKGSRLVVFNPLSWKRTELINLENGTSQPVTIDGLGFSIVDNKIKKISSAFSWTPDTINNNLRISGGDGWYEKGGRLITPFYEILIAKTGGFRLIIDRETGNHLIGRTKVSGTFAAMINGMDCESLVTKQTVTTYENLAVLVETGEIGGIPFISQWTFYKHTPRIDWHGEFDFNNQYIGRPRIPFDNAAKSPTAEINKDVPLTITAFNDHEYKLRLRFYPLLMENWKGIRDLPFNIVETADDYINGNYWTAVSDDRVGLAYFNKGLMGSIHEHDGAFSSVLAFSMPYIWGTRMLKGKYDYDLGIMPFQNNWKSADLHRSALEYNFPIVQTKVNVQRRTLGNSWTPYLQKSGEAIISALYEKNSNLYIRFYEYAGKSTDLSFEWNGKPVSNKPVNLREQEQTSDTNQITLMPWQVQTFLIK
jgi:alpha-mannosidase